MTDAATREIGVGMLGYGFMGKAHSNAFHKIAYTTRPPPLLPRLVAIYWRTEAAVAEAARRYGYERWTSDWRDLVTDNSIGLFDKNALQWELNGTKGSIAFDVERLNELQVFRAGTRGFETVLVTEPGDPFLEWWWPPGHIIGWEHTFVHEIHHLLQAIAEDSEVAPLGATFEDGYRAAEVCDAILRSAVSGRREDIVYR
jgi:predicted dehydrogenase